MAKSPIATGRWRTGGKVKINVYDENGKPVCQCQSEEYATLIVGAVNAHYRRLARDEESQATPRKPKKR